MKTFGKKKRPQGVIAHASSCDPLPTCGLIHPFMSHVLDPYMEKMCDRFNISIWDRDRLRGL